jgi:transcription-repair coupling factor (superfamily II helicase)
VVTFRDNTFANPDRLVTSIRQQGPQARVQPDQKVVFFQDWSSPEKRLKGTTAILSSLASSVKPAKAA